MRLGKGVMAIAIVAFAGYWATDNHVFWGPTIHIRNETPYVAWLEISGYDHDGTDYLSVPAVKPGMCATATWTWHHHGNPSGAGTQRR